MTLRTLFAAASLVASMAVPSLAGAQVQVRAGIRVGGPTPVVVAPPPPVVVAPAPVVVVPAPIVVAQPARPVVVARPARWHRGRRVVVVHTPDGVYVTRRHRRHWRH